MGQIAKSIVIRLNNTESELRDNKIDPDIVEFAGWCHDLGHPPFGHQGELALDRLMREEGGFEGNAQTLRILSRLEKRQHDAKHHSGIDQDKSDRRLGLNLTARSLAAILKYDHRIPDIREKSDSVTKGYYSSDSDVVSWIKRNVAPNYSGTFKTVECQIMDIADDIAYSTYDLEDTFKAGFFGPLDMFDSSDNFQPVIKRVSDSTITVKKIIGILNEIFSEQIDFSLTHDGSESFVSENEVNDPIAVAGKIHLLSSKLMQDGYIRSAFTSQLIRYAIEGIEFEFNKKFPCLSKVKLSKDRKQRVEILKIFIYERMIRSPRVTVSQFRAEEILNTIFESLSSDERLLPEDVQLVYDRIDESLKKRVLCDYIAGMTDRYALEFYGRIRSENPQTIFKPL